ncbi:hypothetical protein M8J75_002775 [Diaphorina citri]|nr:hypothetical protein M8J75_002775 [Diaphorina citri]
MSYRMQSSISVQSFVKQLKIDFYKHVHDLGSKLLVCLNDSHSHVLNESLRNSFHDILGSYGVDLDSYGDYDMRQIQSCVFGVVVDGLRKTIVENSASELADDAVTSNASAYLALAEFIRTHARVSPEFPADAAFIESLLRATACGALKARQLFPLLLQLPGLADHSALFRERSPLLLPIVQRIATEYPSAVKLPFNINAERYSANPALVALIDQLKFSVHESKLYGSLALCTLPGTVLRCHLEHIVTMDKTNLDQVNQAVSAMNSDCFSLKPDLNDAVFEFCKKYRRAVSDGIQAVTASRSVDKLHRVLEDVRKNEKTKRNWELKQVSRYLGSYGSGGEEQGLEIPGQYSGLTCPVPRHHVKIAGFKPTIRVMQSLKRPVQIIILGNDGQEYPWLIKYNEDLRSDERIQAMFSLYNTGLQTVRRCVNRELSLATYRVVSLSDNSGMIQWVPNTRVLGGLSKAWLTQHLGSPYQKFHMKFVSPNTPPHVAYETSMARRTRDEIVANFAAVTNKLPKFAMREGLLSVAKSPMNRVRLRNNFVRIGDRHLENTLVCTETGRCVGIDFGYSFGVATQLLPIPELMPFRLTPHILAVNEPYGSQGLIRESMVHAMSCLRAHADVILCALQVFIQEPCSDWLVMLRRKIAREGVSEAKEQEEKGAAYMEWYPEAKIRVCEQKLRGLPSTSIMNQELEFRSPSSFSVCARYVSGEVGSFRKRYEGRELLTVGDQVDCLLDHATDWGILGVTWAGWAPYV